MVLLLSKGPSLINEIDHITMAKPLFYKDALSAFKKFSKASPSFDPLCKTKYIYNVLLNMVMEKPRIFRVNPQIDYNRAFTNCSNSLLSSEARDITFRTIHQIVPVNSYLYRMRQIVQSPKCCFCKTFEETIQHLFSTCGFVIPLWVYIKSLFKKLQNNIDNQARLHNLQRLSRLEKTKLEQL